MTVRNTANPLVQRNDKTLPTVQNTRWVVPGEDGMIHNALLSQRSIYNAVAATAILISMLAGWGLEAFAQDASLSDVSQSPKCKLGMESAKSRLNQVPQIKLKVVNAVNHSSYHTQIPAGRPYSISFAIIGDNAVNVMHSPVLLKEVSTYVIGKCQSVGAVNISVYASEWNVTHGLFGDGSIQKFGCMAVSKDRNVLPWGMTPCF